MIKLLTLLLLTIAPHLLRGQSTTPKPPVDTKPFMLGVIHEMQ